jgi:hypothetical protein
VTEAPIPKWLGLVNEPPGEEILESIRSSVKRGRPDDDDELVQCTAEDRPRLYHMPARKAAKAR